MPGTERKSTMTTGQFRGVIVTGASGFVGRYVVAELVQRGHAVTALVRNPAVAQSLSAMSGAKVVAFDLSDPYLPDVVDNSGTLIHCAWGDVRDHGSIRHIEDYMFNSYRFIKNAAARGVSKVIVTGTSWEYGKIYGPVAASAVPRPNTLYGASKHLLHQLLQAVQPHYGFDLIWARLFYVYGEGEDPRSLIALFDKALERGDKSFNMSLGEQLYDYLPVQEGASQIASLLDADAGTYNVCSGKPISLRRLLEERMKERGQHIHLNLGFYPYREQDPLAIWGADPQTHDRSQRALDEAAMSFDCTTDPISAIDRGVMI